jgi:hypothetical protein
MSLASTIDRATRRSEVEGLLAALGGVYQDVRVVAVDPDGGDLRRAVLHERDEVSEVPVFDELALFGR